MTKKKLQNLIRANQTFKDKINKINQLHKKIKKITIKIMSMKIKVKNKLEGNKKFFI